MRDCPTESESEEADGENKDVTLRAIYKFISYMKEARGNMGYQTQLHRSQTPQGWLSN